MPVLTSDYAPPLPFRSGHLNTILPNLVRRVRGLPEPERVRYTLPDTDFVDVDHYLQGSDRLLLVLHGLEGDSRRPYARGMARAFYQRGWDVAVLNFRSCSGEPNRLLRMYHAGETTDTAFVLSQLLHTGGYDKAVLVGFSLGGNVALKLMGEQPDALPDALKGCVAISVPVDLMGSTGSFRQGSNRIYRRRFLKKLGQKLHQKATHYPDDIDLTDYRKRIRTLQDFDDCYTAPIHGFRDAVDYYTRNSSLQYLHRIDRPTLLLNARNDSFLSESCYPRAIGEQSEHLFVEFPRHGGHVGFVDFHPSGQLYSERRAVWFVEGYI